jgi:hypothetical protein
VRHYYAPLATVDRAAGAMQVTERRHAFAQLAVALP